MWVGFGPVTGSLTQPVTWPSPKLQFHSVAPTSGRWNCTNPAENGSWVGAKVPLPGSGGSAASWNWRLSVSLPAVLLTCRSTT